MRWKRYGHDCIGVIVPHTVRRQRVNGGRLDAGVPVAVDVVSADRIEGDEKYGRHPLGWPAGLTESCRIGRERYAGKDQVEDGRRRAQPEDKSPHAFSLTDEIECWLAFA